MLIRYSATERGCPAGPLSTDMTRRLLSAAEEQIVGPVCKRGGEDQGTKTISIRPLVDNSLQTSLATRVIFLSSTSPQFRERATG